MKLTSFDAMFTEYVGQTSHAIVWIKMMHSYAFEAQSVSGNVSQRNNEEKLIVIICTLMKSIHSILMRRETR